MVSHRPVELAALIRTQARASQNDKTISLLTRRIARFARFIDCMVSILGIESVDRTKHDPHIRRHRLLRHPSRPRVYQSKFDWACFCFHANLKFVGSINVKVIRPQLRSKEALIDRIQGVLNLRDHVGTYRSGMALRSGECFPLVPFNFAALCEAHKQALRFLTHAVMYPSCLKHNDWNRSRWPSTTRHRADNAHPNQDQLNVLQNA